MINNCDQSFNNLDKPSWDEHDYPAICMCSNSNWFGLREAKKPPYSQEWKGKAVHLLSGKADFLKYGKCEWPTDIEDLYEVRPVNINIKFDEPSDIKYLYDLAK